MTEAPSAMLLLRRARVLAQTPQGHRLVAYGKKEVNAELAAGKSRRQIAASLGALIHDQRSPPM